MGPSGALRLTFRASPIGLYSKGVTPSSEWSWKLGKGGYEDMLNWISESKGDKTTLADMITAKVNLFMTEWKWKLGKGGYADVFRLRLTVSSKRTHRIPQRQNLRTLLQHIPNLLADD